MAGRRKRSHPSSRRSGAWLLAAAVVVAAVAYVSWPRASAYAKYADGSRPTVVFVWSDPTPHHPYG